MARQDFVPITREEFEDWLDSTRLHWKRMSGKIGVYILELSPNVGIYVSSSVGGHEQVRGLGRAAIHMKLISRKTGRTLNKKGLGQSRFNRTKNWRLTLTRKGVDVFKKIYEESREFYDTIAVEGDSANYKADWLAKIEGAPGWQDNAFLKDLHSKIEQGRILTEKQRAAVERAIAQAAHAPAKLDDALLDRLRQLWVSAKRRGDQWLMDFVKSVGEQIKAGRPLSDKQQAAIDKNMASHRIRVAQGIMRVASRHLARREFHIPIDSIRYLFDEVPPEIQAQIDARK